MIGFDPEKSSLLGLVPSIEWAERKDRERRAAEKDRERMVAEAEKRAHAYRNHPHFTGEPGNTDPVEHPAHYTGHPSGVECIQITEHMNFCRGNAVKYIWRAGEKGDEIEDLRKAIWYLQREIERVSKKSA